MGTFKIGILTSAYIDYGLTTALTHIADAGFEHVEIAAVDGALEHVRQEEMTAARAAALRHELAQRGLTPTALAGHTPISADGAVEKMCTRLRFAAELGCGVLVGTCGPKDRGEQLAQNLEAILPEAERLGVVIALETNADYISNGREGQKFVAQWNSPCLGLTYDAGNTYRGMRGEIDTVADLTGVVQSIRHLHMKDLVQQDGQWRFCQPGQGVLDMAGLLAVIKTRTAPLGVDLELPYVYRFPYLGAPLAKLPCGPAIEDIDRDAKAYLETMRAALAGAC